jgi:hypothetical protein
MHAIPVDLFPTSDQVMRPALVIAHLALEFYINDIKALVIAGVNKWITDAEHDNNIPRDTVNRVTNTFKRWTSQDQPFAYAHYLLLCDIVKPNTTILPPSSAPRLTLRTFLKSLIQLGLRCAKSGPPFVKGGSFQHVLPTALSKLQAYAAGRTQDPLAYVEDILERVWLSFNIHWIPWTSAPDPGQRGRPSSLVVYNAWSRFGGQRDPQELAKRLQPHQLHTAAVERNMQLALRDDADAPWSTADMTIQDIHTILHRHQLPDDFVLPVSASRNEKAAYVMETYRYVRENFSLPNPLHQLALIVGIVFSKLTPNVFLAKPASIPASRISTEQSTQQYLNTLGWETRTKKGLQQQNIFMSMVTTYIVAMYDSNSPLRKYIQKHGNLGDSWADKHSTCFFNCIEVTHHHHS